MSGVAGAALPTVHSGPPANSLKTLDQVTSVCPGTLVDWTWAPWPTGERGHSKEPGGQTGARAQLTPRL